MVFLDFRESIAANSVKSKRSEYDKNNEEILSFIDKKDAILKIKGLKNEIPNSFNKEIPLLKNVVKENITNDKHNVIKKEI
jgi:hypothetical protein